MIEAESIYIHIPFCKTKCPYCDFASWAKKEDQIEKYFDALTHEINTKCEAYEKINTHILASKSIKTIFIGGGTPSLIPPELYERLFKELKEHFVIDNDCEITLELNPGTARENYLKGYKDLGINRLSIGAQSFNENILEVLGRKHSIKETEIAINLAKNAGFLNINLDLIYSVPGMTKEIWTNTIQKALTYEPKHISSYSLIIESGTPFELIYKDKNKLPNDDFSYELYNILCNILKKSGFIHYEISNFSKPGFESKHNLTYWLSKEYFAFGVSAHRFLNGLRTCNTRSLEEYIKNPNIECITEFPIDYNFEKLMLSSRLNKGFKTNLIKKTSSKDNKEINDLLKKLEKNGLLELKDDNARLTEKGMYLNNEILLQLTR